MEKPKETPDEYVSRMIKILKILKLERSLSQNMSEMSGRTVLVTITAFSKGLSKTEREELYKLLDKINRNKEII